jgi:hypothetical protein
VRSTRPCSVTKTRVVPSPVLSTPRSHLPPKDAGARVRSTRLSAILHLATRIPGANACSPCSSRLTVLEASGRSQSPTYSRILHPIVQGTYNPDDALRCSSLCWDSRCRSSAGLHEAESRQRARDGDRFSDVPTKDATCQWHRPCSVLFRRIGSRLRGGRELHQPVIDGSASIKPMAAIHSSGPKPSLLRSISFARTTT